jgi:hypothetical protein
MSLDILEIGSSKWSARNSVFRALPESTSIIGEPTSFTLPNVADVSIIIFFKI